MQIFLFFGNESINMIVSFIIKQVFLKISDNSITVVEESSFNGIDLSSLNVGCIQIFLLCRNTGIQ